MLILLFLSWLLPVLSAVLLDKTRFSPLAQSSGPSLQKSGPISQASSQHDKRQILHRSMVAALYFTCPEHGSMVRTFRWEARYSFSQQRITLWGLDNIDSFDAVHVSLLDFSTFLHHSYCKAMAQYPYSICFYHIRMQVYGRVNRHSISMGITRVATVEGDEPLVEESCVYTARMRPAPGLNVSQCVAVGPRRRKGPVSVNACRVTDLRVYTVPN